MGKLEDMEQRIAVLEDLILPGEHDEDDERPIDGLYCQTCLMPIEDSASCLRLDCPNKHCKQEVGE